eukprot:768587-Hanusia_phi.AAC.8
MPGPSWIMSDRPSHGPVRSSESLSASEQHVGAFWSFVDNILCVFGGGQVCHDTVTEPRRLARAGWESEPKRPSDPMIRRTADTVTEQCRRRPGRIHRQ